MGLRMIGNFVSAGRGLPAAALVAGAAAWLTGNAVAQDGGGTFAPVISINEVMVYVIDHNSHALWDVAVSPPDGEEDWHLLGHAAVTMATAGNMISIGGTGASDAYWSADSAWRAFAQAMSSAGLESLEAVRARDVDALVKAGNELVATCEGCHRTFKPGPPAVTAQKHMH